MMQDILEEAARWHARQDRDDMDWEGFTAWLEADPRHRDVFDDVALLDERVARHRATLREAATVAPARDGSAPTRRHRRRWAWAASAVAASAAVVALVTVRQADPGPATTIYRADAGGRVVDLGRGAQAALSPGSVLTAENDGTRRLLLSGRAFFQVVHDPDRQFTVEAGGYRIRDVGTRFEVATAPGMMRVAVAEGRIAVGPHAGGPEVEIAEGRSLTAVGERLTTAAVRPRDVGGWRAGPLVYDGVPLGIVAADVARATGRRVTVDGTVAGRAFTGVLAPSGADAMVEALTTLAGLQARRDGDTIRLGDRRPR